MLQLNYIRLKSFPIFAQLQLEEALLKADTGHWCLINEGTSPAIVMGISGKQEALIDLDKLKLEKIPVIRRFTGGGTVLVDEETIFVTFIFNSETIKVHPYPEHVLHWSKEFYQGVFEGHPFQLQENDYAMGDLKFGGNAQYMRKQRWLHHSSLLWDFDSKRMELLLLPAKRPAYRAQRTHQEFLCTLKNYFSSKEDLISRFENRLSRLYSIKSCSLNEIDSVWERVHHRSTQIVPI